MTGRTKQGELLYGEIEAIEGDSLLDDLCHGVSPLWLGTGLGAILGWAAGGAPEWRRFGHSATEGL